MAPKSDESFASLFENSTAARAGTRRYRVGESVEVTIVSVGRDSVFADLGGKQEGAFDKSELSDAGGLLLVEVGSRVTAIVRRVDDSSGLVELQPVVVKREQDEPGVTVQAQSAEGGPTLVEGARVHGKVTGVERYGVFVQIDGTHGRTGRGLVPTQETGTARGADLKKHFQLGQDVTAKIMTIDESGKIRLSISALAGDDERSAYEAFRAGQRSGSGGEEAAAPAAASAKPRKAEPRNLGTLGDLLKKKAR